MDVFLFGEKQGETISAGTHLACRGSPPEIEYYDPFWGGGGSIFKSTLKKIVLIFTGVERWAACST